MARKPLKIEFYRQQKTKLNKVFNMNPWAAKK